MQAPIPMALSPKSLDKGQITKRAGQAASISICSNSLVGAEDCSKSPGSTHQMDREGDVTIKML